VQRKKAQRGHNPDEPPVFTNGVKYFKTDPWQTLFFHSNIEHAHERSLTTCRDWAVYVDWPLSFRHQAVHVASECLANILPAVLVRLVMEFIPEVWGLTI
jgi:hypothetical protein